MAVYDVTARDTFEGLPTWFNELETFSTSPEVVKIIVGNKVDKVREPAKPSRALQRKTRTGR